MVHARLSDVVPCARAAPDLIVFTDTRGMRPDGDEILHALIARDHAALWALASALFRAGAKTQARLMGHLLFHSNFRRIGLAEKPDYVAKIADIAQPLAEMFDGARSRYRVAATTNLAAARQIIAQGWLEAEGFRDRIEALGDLHGATISTTQAQLFVAEIMPAVMARHTVEPHAAVRERLAFVLEAACIRGDVFAEARHMQHSAAVLALVDFCIANGVQTRMNQGCRVALLWALGRDDEARDAEQLVIDTWGDDVPWPGRLSMGALGTCRTSRLWLLMQKARASRHCAAASEAGAARLANRPVELRQELDGLIARYGSEAATWEEVAHVEEYLEAW